MKRILFTVLCVAALSVSADGLSRAQVKVRAALDDELFEVASEQSRVLLRKAKTEEQRASAAMLLAESLFKRKEFAELHSLASEILTGKPDAAELEGLAYWDARAWFEKDEFGIALKMLDPYVDALNKSQWAAQTFRLRSFCYMTQEEWTQAEATFIAFQKQFPDHADAKRNLLDLAGLYKQLGRMDEAQAIWEGLLNEQAGSAEANEAALLLVDGLIRADAKKNGKRVAELLEPLTGAEPANDFSFQAWQLAAVQAEKMGDPAAAISALTSALATTPDPAIKMETTIAIARLHVQAKESAKAIALLDRSIITVPDQALAAAALLEKAQIYLAEKSYSEAEKSFQSYLSVSDDSAGKVAAARGKAWSLWHQGRYAEAALAFEKSARLAPDTASKIEARLKVGDSYYIEEKYDQALSAYNAAAVSDMQHPLAPQASYLAGLCLTQLGQSDVALPHFKKLQKQYPDSLFAQKAAIEEGQIYDQQAHWELALETYNAVREKTLNTTIKTMAMNRGAVIYYRLNQFELALSLFEEVLKMSPKSKEAEQAFYMRGFCKLHLGKPDEALAICREFIEKYPDSEWATDVTFWAGEYHYNHGDYKKAEESFTSIVKGYPTHAMADDALYWAGRSATAQEQFTTALDYYSALAKNYPESKRLEEGRFAQGEVLSELGDFARAILAFDEVIKNYPTSHLSDLAWGRKGDCHFTLGTKDVARYTEARGAYQVLLQSAGASPSLRLQARYKIGRCEEKLNRPSEAVSQYTSLIYSYLSGEVEPTPENILWFTRAAFSAGAVKEDAEAWREAVNLYQRVVEAKVPAADEAQKRIDSIQKKHFYLFNS